MGHGQANPGPFFEPPEPKGLLKVETAQVTARQKRGPGPWEAETAGAGGRNSPAWPSAEKGGSGGSVLFCLRERRRVYIWQKRNSSRKYEALPDAG